MAQVTNILDQSKFLIGMVHLGPLLGYSEFHSISEVIINAIKDAETLKKAGFDAILVENNYDLPHKIIVEPGTIVSFGKCISEIQKIVDMPIGVCVLWNDYKTALSLAKIYDLQFIRVAVFVDNVRTDYGDIFACNAELNKYKKEIGAEEVKVFTDIQVKHSILLNVRPIRESALEAVDKGSDALIVTGKWTGDMPLLSDLQEVRGAVGQFPIVVGSGSDEENLQELLTVANGIIVGTSIKTGVSKDKSEERNLKPYQNRIDLSKASMFAKKFAECRLVS